MTATEPARRRADPATPPAPVLAVAHPLRCLLGVEVTFAAQDYHTRLPVTLAGRVVGIFPADRVKPAGDYLEVHVPGRFHYYRYAADLTPAADLGPGPWGAQ